MTAIEKDKFAQLLYDNPFVVLAWGSTYKEAVDFLLENGVTFATDTNVGSKWISVEDEKPKKYSLAIVWDPDCGVGEAEWDGNRFHWTDNGNIAFATHWMPLPEPPREV